MERSTLEFLAPEGYSLDRQLAIATRRLADARAAAQRAFDEYRIVEASDSRIEAIRIADARAALAGALCRQLRAVIQRLETQRDTGDIAELREAS